VPAAPRVRRDPPDHGLIDVETVRLPGSLEAPEHGGRLDHGAANPILEGNLHSAGSQESIARIDDRRQVHLVQRQRATQITDQDIRPGRQIQPGREAPDELDAVRQSVGLRDLGREINRVQDLHGKHAAGAPPTGQHGEQARAAADLEDRTARGHRLSQRSHIGLRAHAVREHQSEVIHTVHGTKSARFWYANERPATRAGLSLFTIPGGNYRPGSE